MFFGGHVEGNDTPLHPAKIQCYCTKPGEKFWFIIHFLPIEFTVFSKDNTVFIVLDNKASSLIFF